MTNKEVQQVLLDAIGKMGIECKTNEVFALHELAQAYQIVVNCDTDTSYHREQLRSMRLMNDREANLQPDRNVTQGQESK